MLTIIIALIIILFSINPILKYFGKNEINYNFAIPLGMFLALCYIAYELKFNFIQMIITFGFGVIIGALIENTLIKRK